MANKKLKEKASLLAEPFFVAKQSPFVITGLTPSTSYNLGLTVYDKLEDYTVWGQDIVFTTYPNPPVITEFTVYGTTSADTVAHVKFKATTDDTLTKANCMTSDGLLLGGTTDMTPDQDGYINFTLVGLQPNNRYSIVLYVYDTHGQFGQSSPFIYKTKSPLPVINSVTMLGRTQDTIKVMVNYTTSINVVSYEYKYNGNTIQTAENPYTMSGLTIGTEYELTVIAYNSEGEGSDPFVITLMTSSDGPVVSSIDITEITKNSAKATVNLSTTVPVVNYIYFFNGRSISTDENFVVMDNLIPYTEYTLTVKCTDQFGDSSNTKTTFTTLPDGVVVNTFEQSDETFTSVKMSFSFTSLTPIKTIQVIGIDREGGTLTRFNSRLAPGEVDFGTFDDLSFDVINVPPNSTYELHFIITNIANEQIDYYPKNSTGGAVYILLKPCSFVINSVDITPKDFTASVKINATSQAVIGTYRIQGGTASAPNSIDITSTSNTIVLNNLIPDTSYFIYSQIYDSYNYKSQARFPVSGGSQEFHTTPEQKTVSFIADVQPPLADVIVFKGSSINLNDYIPVKVGYNFDGWYIGDTKYEGTYIVNDDVTFTAKFSIIVLTVTYINGVTGATLKTETVNYGSDGITPDIPEITGYTFTGWDKLPIFVVENITCTAQYSANEYTLTFIPYPYTISLQSKTVTYGQSVGILPTPEIPTIDAAEGVTFVKWFYYADDGSVVTISNNQIMNYAGDLSLTAEYSKYSITYIDGGLEGQPQTNEITPQPISFYAVGATITLGTPTIIPPANNKYSFMYYCVDSFLSDKFTETTMPMQTINLFAKYSIKYQISFDDGIGNTTQPIYIAGNSAISGLPSLLRTGYIFSGWYLEQTYQTLVSNGDIYTWNTDIVLYAKWEGNGDLKFNSATTTASIVNTVTFDNSGAMTINFKNENLTMGKKGTITTNTISLEPGVYSFTCPSFTNSVCVAYALGGFGGMGSFPNRLCSLNGVPQNPTWSTVTTFGAGGGGGGGDVLETYQYDVCFQTPYDGTSPVPSNGPAFRHIFYVDSTTTLSLEFSLFPSFDNDSWSGIISPLTMTVGPMIVKKLNTIIDPSKWKTIPINTHFAKSSGEVLFNNYDGDITYLTNPSNIKALPSATSSNYFPMLSFNNVMNPNREFYIDIVGESSTLDGAYQLFKYNGTTDGTALDFINNVVPDSFDRKGNNSVYSDSTVTGIMNLGLQLSESRFSDYYQSGTLVISYLDPYDPVIVTFNPNGGTTPESKRSVNRYEKIGTLPAPTRNGYTFLGWFTQLTGGTKYTGTEVITDTLTLYAHWSIINYTITYNLGGGTNNPSNPTSYNFESNTIVLQPATRTGYIFNGWRNTSTNQPVTQIPKGSFGNLIVEAQWTIITYTITFNPNGGTLPAGQPEQITVNYGSSVGTLPNAVPEDGWYQYAGWFTDPSSGTQWSSSTIPTQDTTIFAHYSLVNFTLTLKLKTETVQTITFNKNTPNTNLPNVVREGYEGTTQWYDNASFTGTQYLKYPLDIGPVNKTLYAKLTPIKYYLYLDGNGGTLPPVPPNLPPNAYAEYTIETSLTYQGDPTPPEGKNFTGWTGDGITTPTKNVSYPIGTIGDKNLIANYEFSTYQIKMNDMNGNITTYTVTYNTPISVPNPTRSGYNFIGWYYEQYGVGSYIGFPATNPMIDRPSNQRTAYAWWEQTPTNISGNMTATASSSGLTVSNSKTASFKLVPNYWNSNNTLIFTAGTSLSSYYKIKFNITKNPLSIDGTNVNLFSTGTIATLKDSSGATISFVGDGSGNYETPYFKAAANSSITFNTLTSGSGANINFSTTDNFTIQFQFTTAQYKVVMNDNKMSSVNKTLYLTSTQAAAGLGSEYVVPTPPSGFVASYFSGWSDAKVGNTSGAKIYSNSTPITKDLVLTPVWNIIQKNMPTWIGQFGDLQTITNTPNSVSLNYSHPSNFENTTYMTQNNGQMAVNNTGYCMLYKASFSSSSTLGSWIESDMMTGEEWSCYTGTMQIIVGNDYQTGYFNKVRFVNTSMLKDIEYLTTIPAPTKGTGITTNIYLNGLQTRYTGTYTMSSLVVWEP